MAFFAHRDWVGTRRAITNATGATTDLRQSLPFGDGASNLSGSQDNTYDGFATLWAGGSTATSHAQFREYWNTAGRWLQPDPYYGSYSLGGPQSFNRYTYALSNPLGFIDPLGLDVICYDVSSSNYINGDYGESDFGYGQDCIDTGGGGGGSGGGGGGSGGGGGGGGAAGGASNNPKTPSQCFSQAFHEDGNGASVLLDLAGIGAGFIPGGGLVEGGVTATRVAFGVQTGLTVASTVNSAVYKSAPGVVAGILGGQVSLIGALTTKGLWQLGEDVGKALPIVGVGVNAAAAAYDISQFAKAYNDCITGKHE
jgi:RHS repeat-associated protein